MRYPIPAACIETPHIAIHEVQKSQFIGWCAAIETAADTARLIADAQTRYPDASHHCSAFIAGAPGDDQAIGFSDDGEPGGTAGRPMYQVLAGSGLGHIACVVTRYFGGTKLGTGGLARAYAQTVSQLLVDLPQRTHIPRRNLTLDVRFADEQPTREWLAQHEGTIRAVDYHEAGVTLQVGWPTDATADFEALDARLGGRLSQAPDI
ncbi:YigZ family protein [Salinisphaera sp. Q1T1-3]|uniref:IMPACT family protein n=1 Tax=Salinisphaera sp. Q1T1-3 TaxID=2321229 RepID=UPI000E747920|nr:YigZ family protein [Salinisphaera sp. Q1T1-3]RJS93254.1 DUF1949 domain-containing protein [Salinisphaera sp. Q1T1-3]